jgi:hypothetical protein
MAALRAWIGSKLNPNGKYRFERELQLMRLPTKVLLAIMCVGIVAACGANAMAIDSAVINERVFNDDPTSTLTTTNSYPSLVEISDTRTGGGGFANLHTFHLADAGVPHPFANNEPSSFSADLTISGAGDGEACIQVAPWWSAADGNFNFRTTDGEIAVFGGRLPFYSFTASQSLTYTKGDTVRAGVVYNPHGLSSVSPATITYNVNIGGTDYTSGPLAFDEGNPLEGFGSWGHLDDARIGGYVKVFNTAENLTAQWGNMSYSASIPEPASMVLAGLGVLGLMMLRRKR